MNLIGVTQTVCVRRERQERGDYLDRRWSDLLLSCGLVPYLIPNHVGLLPIVLQLPLKGIILTGGNDLNRDAPERDHLENALLKHALSQRIPVLGVCRGMELILTYFGAQLQKVDGHVCAKHSLMLDCKPIEVNSYHHYGTYQVGDPLKIMAVAPDGVIEAVEHTSLPIKGIMWHPERDLSPLGRLFNTNILRELFDKT